MKRQSTEWEKIFANDMTEKELIPNMWKELIQLNIQKKKKKSNLILKMGIRTE